MIRRVLLGSLRWAAFAALLLAAAAIREGRSAAVDQAIIWLPTGVAIAGAYVFGYRAAWVVALVTFTQRMLLGYDLGVAASAVAGSAFEALLGALVLRRLGFRPTIERLRDVAALFVSAGVAPLGSIAFSWLGRSYFWEHPSMPFYSGWDGWWRMNALGALAVVPLVVTWSGARPRDFRPRRIVALALALVGLPALVFVTTSLVPPGITGVMWLNVVLMPPVLYAAGRFGMRGATLAGTLTALAIAVLTTRGVGPFLEVSRAHRHVAIQLFELAFVAMPPVFGALIAGRRAAEDRGARSEALLASIGRNVKEGVFRLTTDLRVAYANPALATMFGFGSAADVLGRAILEPLVARERRAELERAMAERGQWLNEEVHVVRADGAPFWGLLSATAVRDEEGRIAHYDGTLADVTERRELEERLRQSQKMEAVGKLAGGVAHDFNNLLTVIFGYAESLRAQAAERTTARDDAEQILDAARRASGLTRQMLAFSRQQVLSPRVVELREVVDRMGDMLRRIIGEDIQLVVRHESGPCWVRVDPSQVEQVLLNLAVNARDAMHGGGTLTISTAIEPPDPARARSHPELATSACVSLKVRDTGIGMTEEVRRRAFDPFFTTKAPGSGTGLGLSTVHGIVEQSGGAVRLESSPGSGTTVWIDLPARAAPADSADPSPSVEAARTGGTVLVVEDEPGVRALVSRTLAGAGYRVLEAGDGVAGLEVARRHGGAIDLVVTDLVMPRLGGREMAARLRSERPGARVLFLSGYAETLLETRDLSGPASAFLAKPFTPEELLARVRAMFPEAARRA